MTDEQIKHNAVAYSEKNKHAEITLSQMAYAAHISGAHSRDKEIKELTKRIEELEDEVAQLVNGENY